ncbi:MAG: hypothetical protein WC876_01435 [Candidatus Thermoplasmatota archaeon]|jgi:hypothetical protein
MLPAHAHPGPAAPHASSAVSWAILMGFLAFTLFGVILYLVRLAQAAP